MLRPLPLTARLILLLFAVSFGGCTIFDPDGTPTIAQRPTFSFSADTAAVGSFEIETGVVLDEPQYFDSPTSLEYGLDESTELFIATSPYRHVQNAGPDGRGVGDLAFGFRHRFRDDDDSGPALATHVTAKVPTADDGTGLGSGKADFLAAGVVTENFGHLSVTGFYQLGFLGQVGGNGAVDIEHGLALYASHPVAGPLSIFGELTGIFAHEQNRSQAFTIWGLAWQITNSIAFDIGGSFGLTNDTADFQGLIGLTVNFGGPSQ